MQTEQDLIQKLMVSKKIMDKHNEITRGSQGHISNQPALDEFKPVEGKYNLPEEFLSEQQMQQPKYTDEVPTQERIMNSKLPDEIKKLMLEHPIEKPNVGGASNTAISNELAEKAARLMNTKANGELISENKTKPTQQSTYLNPNDIKSIIKETVREVLKENGLLTESETKSDELFKFRVGEHIFEGKVVRIKKISK
jgi:hypothetical protein